MPNARTGPAGADRHALDRQIGDPLPHAEPARHPHQVLNANHIAAEAEIVKQAGQQGKVTVSTNMAGRGTDIKLGSGVVDMGGLHVILTEMHDAARIDRQLSGRCGRQGDPGTYRQYLGLDDDLLLAGLGPKKSDRLKAYGEKTGRVPLTA